MKPKKQGNESGENTSSSGECSGGRKRRKAEAGFDESGLIKVMQQFNETNVKLQVDLITISNDFKDQLKRMEDRLLRKVKDIETRQQALEIVFETHEKEVDLLKNISRFQLESLNGLFQVVLQLYARTSKDNPGESFLAQVEPLLASPLMEQMGMMQAPIQAPPTLQPQVPFQNTDASMLQDRAETPCQNLNDDYNTSNDDTSTAPAKCGYCHRKFKKERNFLKHMQRIPKYCARRRIKMDVPF